MTFNPRTELLFPPRLIADMRDLRGPEWRELVQTIVALPETHPDVLAFCLMMIRLNSCLSCVSGSYRFMRGCELCAQQTIARYQGTDEELIALYYKAQDDLAHYAEGSLDVVADPPEPEVIE